MGFSWLCHQFLGMVRTQIMTPGHWRSKPIYHQGQNSNMPPPGGVHIHALRCVQLGAPGAWPPRKSFEICVSEMAFPAFWRQFWAKAKHLNRICNSTFLTKLPKTPPPKKCRPGQLPRSPPLASPVIRTHSGSPRPWNQIMPSDIEITKSVDKLLATSQFRQVWIQIFWMFLTRPLTYACQLRKKIPESNALQSPELIRHVIRGNYNILKYGPSSMLSAHRTKCCFFKRVEWFGHMQHACLYIDFNWFASLN